MDFEHIDSGSLERSVHYSQGNYSIHILGLDEILLEARRLDNPAVVLDSNRTSDCLEYALIDCQLTDNPEIQDEEFEVGCELILSPEYLSANPDFDQAFEKYLYDSNYEINDLIIIPQQDNLYLIRNRKLGTNFIILIENQRFHITNLYMDEGSAGNLLVQPMPRNLLSPEAALSSMASTAIAIIEFLEVTDLSKGGAPANLTSNKNRELILKVNPSESMYPKPIPELTVSSPTLEITLDDVIVSENVKEELSNIVLSFTHPEIFQLWGAKRPRGLFFHGPTGTGKSMAARALANEIGAELIRVQSDTIKNRSLGDSEKQIKKIFDAARNHRGRLILFLDEFESLIPNNSDHTDSASIANNSIAGLFKQEMESLFDSNPNVLVIAASNHPEQINPELIRPGRFDTKLYFGLPDFNSRKAIFISYISKILLGNSLVGKLELKDISGATPGSNRLFDSKLNIDQFSEMCEDLSGTDIATIISKVLLNKAAQHVRTGQLPPPISTDEMKRAIQNFKRQIIN